MSVIVRGMKMPKKCLDCPFMISRDNDDCIVQSNEANAKFDSWDDMKASCPLVELPFAEELAEKLYKQIEKAVIEGEGSKTDA